MEQLGFHLMVIHGIYMSTSRKSDEEIHILIKSDKNTSYILCSLTAFPLPSPRWKIMPFMR
jgi:hypothetical protein